MPTPLRTIPKAFWLIPSILLLIALFDLPYGYYQFLKIIVTGAALFIAFHLYKSQSWSFSVVLFSALAVLYNPIVPIHFEKEIWQVINVATVFVFLAIAWQIKRSKPNNPLEFIYAQTAESTIRSAKNGDASAQYQLAMMYDRGLGVPQNSKESAVWMKKAAGQGQAEAQCFLGLMYAEGKGVIQDDEDAALWISKSAEQGYIEAKLLLGIIYATGKGVSQNGERAAFWLKEPAEQGSLDAQTAIKKLAEEGNTKAQIILWDLYANGKGVDKSEGNAAHWLKTAAEQGDVEAQLTLGLAFQDGKCVSQNDKRADYWLNQAAEQGYSEAQFALGLAYKEGKGLFQSDYLAASWFNKAAKQGHAEALNGLIVLAERGLVGAQYDLGKLYRGGESIPKNDDLSAFWLNKSAEQGNEDALEELAEHAMENATAQDYLKVLAQQGNLYAQYLLGSAYHSSKGNLQDYEQAFFWLKKAAEKEEESAYFLLGAMYAEGCFVLQDYERAIFWFLKSAEEGDDTCQDYLGMLYAGEYPDNRTGGPIDYVLAYMWLSLSGGRKLEFLENKMTSTQITQAKCLVAEWKPKK